MATAYSEEIRAAVLADLMTGSSLNATARKFGVDRNTIRRWRGDAGLTVPPPVALEKRANLGEQLYGYLEDSIGALRSQLAVFADPDWLKKQSAAELAILHGVVADKTARLLAAARPGEPDDAIEGAVTEGGGDRDGS